MSTALEEVAAAADQVADDQRRVADRARAMQRLRDRGLAWGEILDGEETPRLLDLMRRSGHQLLAATSRLAETLASGLVGEGESRRRIAGRLGVTHQWISQLLRR